MPGALKEWQETVHLILPGHYHHKLSTHGPFRIDSARVPRLGRAGLSEAKLAKGSGVALGALHTDGLDGAGSHRPSFAGVVKIAKALGTTCEAFADCEDIAEETPTKGRSGQRNHQPGRHVSDMTHVARHL